MKVKIEVNGLEVSPSSGSRVAAFLCVKAPTPPPLTHSENKHSFHSKTIPTFNSEASGLSTTSSQQNIQENQY